MDKDLKRWKFFTSSHILYICPNSMVSIINLVKKKPSKWENPFILRLGIKFPLLLVKLPSLIRWCDKVDAKTTAYSTIAGIAMSRHYLIPVGITLNGWTSMSRGLKAMCWLLDCDEWKLFRPKLNSQQNKLYHIMKF